PPECCVRSPTPTRLPTSSPWPPTSGCRHAATIHVRTATTGPARQGVAPMKATQATAEQIKLDWSNNPRWSGVTRPYSAEDVVRLRGSVHVEHSLARRGAERLWRSLHESDFVNALGALTGNQAMQQAK